MPPLLHPRTWPRLLVLHLAIAVAAVPGLLELSIDNPPWLFFPGDAAELERHERFVQTFGELDTVRIVVSGPALWSESGVAWLRTLERRAGSLPGALATAGLYRHHNRPPTPWPPGGPRALRERALDDPLDRAVGWVGARGEAASLLLVVRELDSGGRRILFEALEALLTEAPAGVDGHLAGIPVLERAFDREIAAFALRFLPVLTALVLLLLRIVYGAGRELLPAVALAGFCELVLFGAIGYLGRQVNLISVLLGPVVLVIAVATVIHLQIRFRRHRRRLGRAAAAVAATYREKRWPLLATGVTTLAAFGSLAASPVPVVRSFGLWAAAGVALVTLSAFTLLPALLATTGVQAEPRPRPFEAAVERFGYRAGAAAARHRARVLLLFALPVAAALAGLPRLRPETGLLRYFSAEHRVTIALTELTRHGIGAAVAELWIGLPAAAGSFDSAAGRLRLERLAQHLEQNPEILGAASVAALPDPPRRPFDRQMRRLLVTEEGRVARVALSIPMLELPRLAALTRSAEAAAREWFPDAEVWTTGSYALVLAGQRTMLRTLLAATLWTVLAIAVVLVLVVGRLRIALLTLIPNLWPVLVALGAMAWLRIPVGGNTVMVGAVILGLAVDDTLHFLGDYRRREPTAGGPAAAAVTLERTAPAHLLTTLVLIAGFAVAGLSRFAPLAEAGLLVSLGLVAALAADLFLLPALLAGGSPDPGPEASAVDRSAAG